MFLLLAACTVHSSCECAEKEELRAALGDALRRAQEQHRQEAAELEGRLQALEQAYREEARRCSSLQQQVGPVAHTRSHDLQQEAPPTGGPVQPRLITLVDGFIYRSKVFYIFFISLRRDAKLLSGATCLANEEVQSELSLVCFLIFFFLPYFQMEELKSSHEAVRQDLESRHSEELQGVREQCEQSLQGRSTTPLCLEPHPTC